MNRSQTSGRAVRGLAIGALTGLVLLCAAAPVWAGNEGRKGTSGAHELRLPVGPRGSALGGSVVGDVTGVESIFWNPAGLGALEGTQALFSHTQYFAEQKLNFAAVATQLGGFGVIGLNVKVLSIGDIIVTTEDAPEGTGDVISPTFTVLGLSLARQFTDRVLFGGTVNLVNERILNTTASGVAFDLGVQYLTGWRGLKLGMAMKNFGTSMEFDGDDFETNIRPPDSDPTSANRTFRSTSTSFEMPSYFTLAATYDVLTAAENRLALLGSFQNNNFIGDNVSGGAEWNYRNTFALRGSYFASIVSSTDPITGEDSGDVKGGDDLYTGLAFGAGARVTTGGSKLGIDVAYRPVRDFFDDTVEVGLRLEF
ncbi:MAG TPA: PorV/PorQ family protein [Candidatus Limnocylindria bacterium]|nr:PorV/PorQ family protein [Candidatus Limnocylindria bacterium]